MLTYAVILCLSVAGYMHAPGWLVLAGTACLTLDGWRLWRLGRQARSAWTSKTRTYFVTGVVTDLGVAALSFGAGRIVRVVLG